jgi:hypothetical protein
VPEFECGWNRLARLAGPSWRVDITPSLPQSSTNFMRM